MEKECSFCKNMEIFLRSKFLKVVFNIMWFVIFVILVELIVPNSWQNIESGSFFDVALNSVVSAVVWYLYIVVAVYLISNTKKRFTPIMGRSSRMHCWALFFWC